MKQICSKCKGKYDKNVVMVRVVPDVWKCPYCGSTVEIISKETKECINAQGVTNEGECR